MTTIRFIAVLFAGLAVLTGVAALWKPAPPTDNRIPLSWVSDNNPGRVAQIAAFNEENPGLALSLDYGSLGVQKVILQCSSGIGPDLFDVYGGDQLQAYVESGVAWDVTDAAERLGFSASGTNAWPGGKEDAVIEGRQYSYPCNIGVNIIIYNKNVFDHLGIPYPDGKEPMTWDEFIALAGRLQEKIKPDERIFPVVGTSWQAFFESQRGEFFTAEGAPRISDNAELARALEMHRDMLFKYRYMPSTLDINMMSSQGGWGSGSINQFGAGRFGMIVTGEWALLGLGRAYKQQVEHLQDLGIDPASITDPLQRPLRLGSMLIPKFADRDPSYRVFCRSAAINSHSPNREEALKFLLYLSGRTYSKTINQGADALPGNPNYAEVGLEDGPEALSRLALHETTIEGMHQGYSFRKSPFLLLGDVLRVMNEQQSRMESDPGLAISELLRAADLDLKTLMRRNLDRSPDLKKRFVERFGAAAYESLP